METLFIDDFIVEVVKGKAIAITQNSKTIRFCIGDFAEYDSYNLKYYGIIKSITDKTVTIEAYSGTRSAKRYRKSLKEFAWRNIRFSKEIADMQNSDTLQYI